jgi:hypothetical protein
MVIAEIPGFWISEIACHKTQISSTSITLLCLTYDISLRLMISRIYLRLKLRGFCIIVFLRITFRLKRFFEFV